ncbi:MAG: hypothetical protein ABJM06_00770 [Gilvibacter sp.]
MKKPIPSRRKFLRNTILASVGLSALGTTSSFANIFDSKLQLNGYLPNADFTTDLRKTGANVMPVTVHGIMYDRQSKLPVSNVLIEVWHLSPDSEEMSYRAKFNTSDTGRYSFITDFPGHGPQLKPRIFFKISDGKKEQFNHLIFDSREAFVDHKQWSELQNESIDLMPKFSYKLETANIQLNHIF